MKKKAEYSIGIIISLIGLLLAIIVISTIIYKTSSSAHTSSNIAVIETWVNQKSAQESISIGGVNTVKLASDIPPISELDEPLIIDSVSDLEWDGNDPPKVYTEIGNSLIDCWHAFGYGEKDFLNNIKRDSFCYPCRQIVFSDEVKSEIKDIDDFYYFLDNYKPGNSKRTYSQILSNANVDEPVETEFAVPLITNENNYIYFTAFSGLTIKRMLVVGLVGEGVPIGYEGVKTGVSAAKDASLVAKNPIIALAGSKEKIVYTTMKSAFAKGLIKGGLKAVPKFIFTKWNVALLPITAGYDIVTADKNFVPSTSLVNADQVNNLCNEKIEVPDIPIIKDPIIEQPKEMVS